MSNNSGNWHFQCPNCTSTRNLLEYSPYKTTSCKLFASSFCYKNFMVLLLSEEAIDLYTFCVLSQPNWPCHRHYTTRNFFNIQPRGFPDSFLCICLFVLGHCHLKVCSVSCRFFLKHHNAEGGHYVLFGFEIIPYIESC